MAREEKPKIFEDSKDIAMSLGVVVIMMVVVVGATGLCTVNPEESQYARTNAVDSTTFLDLESRSTSTAIRDPQLPEGWVANSARRSLLGDQQATVVGWVTADEGFVQASQTPLALEEALKKFDGRYRGDRTTRQVDGTTVEIYSTDERNVRDLWGFDLGDARVILTGSAADSDFETVVRAFLAAQPLQSQRATPSEVTPPEK